MYRDLILFAMQDEAPTLFNQYKNVFEIGVGKVNAAIQTMGLINRYGPVRIINLGTAGGITVGTGIYRINKVFQHDVNLIPLGLKPGQHLNDDDSVIEFEGSGKSCASGDLFVTDPNKLRLHCDIIEMEAYSVAKAALNCKISVEIYKYITDMADNNAAKTWQEHVSSGELLYRHVLKELDVKLEEK
jgi:adenosylhomocysteine nucleosidase